MSDKEDSLSMSDKSEPGLIDRSRSPSANASQKSYNGSINSRSLSRSPIVYKRSASRSRSRERFRVYKRKRSYSRSRSRSHPHYSRSRSRSPRHHKRKSNHHRSRSHSRSHSRGRSPGHHRDGYSDRRRGFQRSHSRSPMSSRRRHQGNRDNPVTSRCLGVFGLSMYTTERELREVFTRYGNLEDVNVVYDRQSGRSRGFAFVYFASHEDAFDAKERCNGTEVDGRRIRVDFSITKRAHTPTPGIYLGKPTANAGGYGRGDQGGQGGRRRSPSPPPYRHNNRRYYSRSRSRSRSYSPRKYAGSYNYW